MHTLSRWAKPGLLAVIIVLLVWNTALADHASITFSQTNSNAGGTAIRGIATGGSDAIHAGVGVVGKATAGQGIGVWGRATSTSGNNRGVFGETASTSGLGVYGLAKAVSGAASGVYGRSDSTTGAGVFGWSTAASGGTYGVFGRAASTNGTGVVGQATAASGPNYGIRGLSNSTGGAGVFGHALATSGVTVGVFGLSASPSGFAVDGIATAATGSTYGVRGWVYSTTGTGVFGWASATNGFGSGVYGRADGWGKGVHGVGGFYGVWGETSRPGTQAAPTAGVAARGTNGALAGLFLGNVYINGNLEVTGTKNFIQPHPTQRGTAIIYVALEGPEAGTYIRGTARLVRGQAIIDLPEHFALVTVPQGLTVQLTPIGSWLQLYVRQQSSRRIIVREAQGRNGQFAYLVQGIRKGYTQHQVIRATTGPVAAVIRGR